MTPGVFSSAIDDERLRLIFSCRHPALAMETRVPLTLRVVGGLTVAEAARVLLVQETRRIAREKAKVKAGRLHFGCRYGGSARGRCDCYPFSAAQSQPPTPCRPQLINY